jgi:hypothetical protein
MDDAMVHGQKEVGNLWSSSRHYETTPPARVFSVEPTFVRASYVALNRNNGISVRCFSNDYLFEQPSMTINTN